MFEVCIYKVRYFSGKIHFLNHEELKVFVSNSKIGLSLDVKQY